MPDLKVEQPKSLVAIVEERLRNAIVDAEMRLGETLSEEALSEAKQLEADRLEAGFDQVALEAAARQGFSNGAFEESDDEGDSVVVSGLFLIDSEANITGALERMRRAEKTDDTHSGH